MDFARAKAERFERCTPKELREFGREQGLKFGPNTSAETMQRKLLEHCGLTLNNEQSNVVRHRATNSITPPYNLTFEGIWEGRRRRIRVPRPADALKGDGAISVSVNGKAPYLIKFNQVEAVPYPIYNRLNEIRAVRAIQVTNPDGTSGTEFNHDDPKILFHDLGDDPDTADRAVDLADWYRGRGPQWFRDRKTHELRSIATVCQLNQHVKNEAGTGTRPMNHDELLAALFVHFWNDLDVIEEGNEPVEQAAKA